MKLYCTVVTHSADDENCLSDEEGSIDISNLDEIINARQDKEFWFTPNNSTHKSQHLPKSFLKAFHT